MSLILGIETGDQVRHTALALFLGTRQKLVSVCVCGMGAGGAGVPRYSLSQLECRTQIDDRVFL